MITANELYGAIDHGMVKSFTDKCVEIIDNKSVHTDIWRGHDCDILHLSNGDCKLYLKMNGEVIITIYQRVFGQGMFTNFWDTIPSDAVLMKLKLLM